MNISNFYTEFYNRLLHILAGYPISKSSTMEWHYDIEVVDLEITDVSPNYWKVSVQDVDSMTYISNLGSTYLDDTPIRYTPDVVVPENSVGSLDIVSLVGTVLSTSGDVYSYTLPRVVKSMVDGAEELYPHLISNESGSMVEVPKSGITIDAKERNLVARVITPTEQVKPLLEEGFSWSLLDKETGTSYKVLNLSSDYQDAIIDSSDRSLLTTKIILKEV